MVCLIANPETMSLTGDLVDRARRVLPESEIDWLGQAEAVEIGPFEGDALAAQRAVREALGGAPVDVCGLTLEGRRKSVLLADMDSTIIQVECIDELAATLGIKPKIAEITRRTMNGELDFETSLAERVALLAGMPEREVIRVAENRTPLTRGARVLVRTMRAHGAVTALVSGGFTLFTSRVCERAGFHVHEANILEVVNGRLTGRIVPPILGGAAKAAALHRLVNEHDLLAEDVLAIGDGANDLAMLQAAGMGVAFHAHPTVRAAIPLRLDVANLTGALYLQGFRRDEFVED